MASRGWDESGDDANKIVMHIAGVAEGCCAGGHDG